MFGLISAGGEHSSVFFHKAIIIILPPPIYYSLMGCSHCHPTSVWFG